VKNEKKEKEDIQKIVLHFPSSAFSTPIFSPLLFLFLKKLGEEKRMRKHEKGG
jgi:hypothetical protein